MRKRFAVLLAVASGVLAAGAFASPAGADVRSCIGGNVFCTETVDPLGEYTGHDEPSLLFYSNTPGSGSSQIYKLVLPSDPPQQPVQDGSGATWNFQLHPAFWFGLAMCDTQSAPEFQHSSCPADSNSNIFDNPDPAAPDYIGHHPGGAFMEMQFYPPGWAPWEAGVSCSPTQWCSALTIDSLSESQVDNTTQNPDCLNHAGIEPVSFAFITKSGVPQASPDPTTDFHPPFAATTVDPSKDLFYNSGDTLVVDMHDTPAGFQVVIHDLTSGQSGSMTASVANGFRQVLYEPKGSSCHTAPYAYHPMYATSSEHTRLTWTAHAYNVAFSDEIGHFEYCNLADENGNCLDNNEGLDDDDGGCFNADDSLLVAIGGCLGTDVDFDGPDYGPNWPGTGRNRGQDQKYHTTPVTFTSPLFNGDQNYSRTAFETDLPRIEAADFGGICDRITGIGCTNPPPGAQFYPIYSTGTSTMNPSHNGHCVWQLGGPDIPGTTDTFGGNSTAEYGPLLFSFYPGPNPATRLRTNNFRQVLSSNPCPA
jgi:hypothetical protein